MPLTLADLAVRFACELRGDPDTIISAVGTLQSARTGDISFLANPKYQSYLANTNASAVIVDEKNADAVPVSALICKDPYAVYAQVADLLHPVFTHPHGIHPSAVVEPNAAISASASVGPLAVIEAGAVIDDRVRIGPGCIIGRDCRIQSDTRLVAKVVLRSNVVIGKRCVLHPGVVVGSDGFGIAQTSEGWIRVPQIGGVSIGDDVDIGSNTTIDRGAIEDTVIENGVKLDNQIQIGHNVHVGEHTVMAACAGVSGSTTIGKRCFIAGMVGFVGHLDITDDVMITGRTMVSSSIAKSGVYSGALSADDARSWRRNSARFKKLDEMAKRLAKLEKRVQSNSSGEDDDG